jgi:hypothetical protein
MLPAPRMSNRRIVFAPSGHSVFMRQGRKPFRVEPVYTAIQQQQNVHCARHIRVWRRLTKLRVILGDTHLLLWSHW